MRFLEDPFRGNWCECVPYKTWIADKTQPIIDDTGITVTATPNTHYSWHTDTITTNTITINADNLYPICAGEDYQTKTNKESEDKKVTKTKKQSRMFYNANTYGMNFRTIRYGASVKDSCYIMPEISDVRHITNKNDVVGVEIKFADNTKQKAICSPNDTFNLEQGITICLFKKLLGTIVDIRNTNFITGHETGIYNKLVNHALKVMKRRIKAEEEAEKKEAERKLKEQRFIEKKRRADARRAKRESEQRINEMAEAIRRSGVVPNMDDGK